MINNNNNMYWCASCITILTSQPQLLTTLSTMLPLLSMLPPMRRSPMITRFVPVFGQHIAFVTILFHAFFRCSVLSHSSHWVWLKTVSCFTLVGSLEILLHPIWQLWIQFQFGYDVHGVDAYGNPNEHSRTEVREGPIVKGKKLLTTHCIQTDSQKIHT